MTSISRFSRFKNSKAAKQQVSDARCQVSDAAAHSSFVKDGSSTSTRLLLREWMQQCRQLTLAQFEGIDYDTFTGQAHADFSPIGWHLGHIAYTESLWLLEHCAGQACQFPQYRRLFAADGLPKAERVMLPSLPEIQSYLDCVREKVFEYLDVAPLEEEERLWRFLLQHESQHGETIALVLELIKHQRQGGRGAERTPHSQLSTFPSSLSTLHSQLSTPDMVCIPAGAFTCGSDSIEALDNERPAHSVYLDTYWIDRYPVTCKQYQTFIEAGGYQDSRWWSAAGWDWLQSAQVTQPLYWRSDPEWDQHPVCGVSWYEADAYARFVGKRLPTELEWEKAARWSPDTEESQVYPWGETQPNSESCNHSHLNRHTPPVTHYPAGKSSFGCYDLLGNVWEWTASWFAGYDGFEPYPYRGYSQAYFDQQHRVLRGGSWATLPWTLRSSFRNWYHPHVREILAGFRCVRGGESC